MGVGHGHAYGQGPAIPIRGHALVERLRTARLLRAKRARCLLGWTVAVHAAGSLLGAQDAIEALTVQ